MTTGISTLGQALDQIERIKEQQLLFGSLSNQLASGKKTRKFSGLGTDILTSKRTRADFKSVETYINNIKTAERRIGLTLTAIEEFQAQAQNFLAALQGLSQESAHQQGDIVYFDDPFTMAVENTKIGMSSAAPDIDLETLQDLAGNIFDFLTDLINQRDGERYLLAGAETLTKPLNNNGALDAAISALVSDWKNSAISTDELISGLKSRDAALDPNAVTDTIVGYSASLSAGNTKKITVRVDRNSEIDYTVMATDQAFRDVLVAAAYIKNQDLPPVADVVDPNTFAVTQEGAPGLTIDEMKGNFYRVLNEMSASVSRALDQVDQLRFRLEGVRARSIQIRQSHEDQKNLLLDTISTVEDVDLNEVAVKINALEIQLQASFSVTALVSELSLVNFFTN